MTFYETDNSAWILRIKLTPNASFKGFRDLYTDADGNTYLKAGVTVAAEHGKANAELIKLLSKYLKIPKSLISIISGATDHCKKIRLQILPSEDMEVKIQNLYNGEI